MKLSRTDLGALTAVAVSGAIGLALFGPRLWGDDARVTVDVTTEMTSQSVITADGEAPLVIKKKKIRRGDGTEEIVVTVEGEGDEDFSWTSEDGVETHVRVVKPGAEGEANVFMLKMDGGAGPEPIVYVDGVLMEGGIPEDLTPDRIDRVEVLKGEAAERMHGADAAVGVVQIFTKPGSGSR
jgi:hypothetical protein